MIPPSKQRARRLGGFSLMELVVIVMVLGILAGIVTPVARQMILESKAQRIIDLADNLRGACHRYWIDTGNPAAEGDLRPAGTGSFITVPSIPQNHELYFNNGERGWNGPYIDHPLTATDAPVEEDGGVSVFDSLVVCGGFLLNGVDGPLFSDAGNCLAVSRVDLEVAMLVDERLDQSTMDEERSRLGRVIYLPNPPDGITTMFVLLLSSP